MGARMTLGMEFMALMQGSKMAAAMGLSASHRPQPRPMSVPMPKASAVYSSVTHRWAQMSALVKNQAQVHPNTWMSSPKKNAACRSFSNTKGDIRPG
jgi:hypothetical protein